MSQEESDNPCGAAPAGGALPSAEPAQWVHWFRSVAPYLHLHHGRTFVISFSGEVVADPRRLNRLVMDLSLMAAVGIRLVVVPGAKPQIEELMALRHIEGRSYKGLRITDTDVMACVKEACGHVRFEVEAAFSQGLPNTPMQHSHMRVVSGNFVTAKPIGVVDGVDYRLTGVVRKVDAEAINEQLARGNIVLVSPFGFSPTGEAFNMTTKEVATAIACALKADKLIISGPREGVTHQGRVERELAREDVERRLAQNLFSEEDAFDLGCAVRALKAGVERVHILPCRMDGAMLLELFTHEGVGTMVAEDDMHAMREATIEDVGGLLKLLEIYEADGTLVKRPREKLEREIQHFTVLEHDGIIYGSAALYPYPEAKMGEMAAVTVHPSHQGSGDGDRLLRRIEQRARAMGLKRIFVLTTRTAHWFLKRGFTAADVSSLPMEKQKLYNWNRRSLIFIKDL